jgi:hypothetical protein
MLQDEENLENFSIEVSVPFDPNPVVMEATAWRNLSTRVCRR